MPKNPGQWKLRDRQKLRRLHRTFTQAQCVAMCQAKRNQLQAIREGRLDLAFQVLGKKAGVGKTAALDPEVTVPFWKRVWTSTDGKSAKDIPPYAPEIHFAVSEDDVKAAIKSMKVKAAGPDGLAVRFIKQYEEDLAPILAPLFTTAMSDPPAALKRGKTILLPKGGGSSGDPGKYRPITLLPVLLRLLHWLIDQILRKTPGVQISETQAGFMPGRSCYEQAILLHLLQTEAVFRWKAPLHAVLLDIAKAFDSLDHQQLLLVTQDLGFPATHLELVRRVLADCFTEIEGQPVELLRGAPQGSPCSPFLAVVYFEGLARAVRAYVASHPEGAPATLAERLGLAKGGELLLTLLQYADDTSLVGRSRAWLQGLLDAISQWADRCRLQFHASKSSTTALSSYARRDQTPLSIQGAAIPAVKSSKILGVPFAEEAHPLLQESRDTACGSIRGGMAKIKELFTVRRRRHGRADDVQLDFKVLRSAVRQVVLARALYAAPVVAMDFDALDKCLRCQLRAMLGLSRTFSSAALHWLLRLWPTRFYAAEARLRLAWRCYHQYWIKDVIRHLLETQQHRTLNYLLTHGPLGLLTEALQQHGFSWKTLAEAEYTPGEKEQATKSEALRNWKRTCRAAMAARVAEWAVAERAQLPQDSPLQAHFPQDVASALGAIKKGLPDFLKLCGDLGRAGLRLLAPSFSSAIPPTSACTLCGADGQAHPAHLLVCPHLPAQLRELRQQAEEHRKHESTAAMRRRRGKSQQLNPDEPCKDSALSLSWPGLRQETLASHLWWIGHAIDACCTRHFRQASSLDSTGSPRGVPYLIGLKEAEYAYHCRRQL
jgi:hypothetical protein